MAPRETENNAYAKFWGDKQRTLWYVMVFLEWSIGFAGGLLCVLSLVTIFCVYSVNLRFNHALITPIKVG